MRTFLVMIFVVEALVFGASQSANAVSPSGSFEILIKSATCPNEPAGMVRKLYIDGRPSNAPFNSVVQLPYGNHVISYECSYRLANGTTKRCHKDVKVSAHDNKKVREVSTPSPICTP